MTLDPQGDKQNKGASFLPQTAVSLHQGTWKTDS